MIPISNTVFLSLSITFCSKINTNRHIFRSLSTTWTLLKSANIKSLKTVEKIEEKNKGSFYERVESVQGIGHALRNRKDEREERKAVFVHLLFFFSLFSSSIGNRFEFKRAAADLTSGPLRPVNRIKWNGGLTK